MKNKGIYLPSADFDRHTCVQERTVRADAGHFHSSIEFAVLLDGEMTVRNFGKSETLRAGEIFFADSFEYHEYLPSGDGARVLAITLDAECKELLRSLYGNKTFPYYMRDVDYNKKVIALARQWKEEESTSALADRGYCCLLFAYLADRYGVVSPVMDSGRNITVELLKYVNEHYTENLSLKDVAEQLGYSKEYCSKIFRKVVGKTFRDYLNSYRLKKYDEEIDGKKHSDYTVTEMMYQCGFNSSATFYRAKKAQRK